MIYRMADDREKILLEIDAEDNASRRIDQVTRSVENLGKSGGGLGSASSGISNFVGNIERGISRVNNVTRQYNNAMRGLNTAVINIVKDMGSAVYDFTTDSIDNFTKFSEQHAKTLGAMAADYDNTAESQRKFFEDSQKLKEQAFNYGTYGVNGQGALMSIPDVSSTQEELIKAGVSADDLTAPNNTIVKDILTFAQANDMDTEQSVQTAVTLGNQFDIDYSDWGLMLDKISHAADMSIVDVSDITQSLKWASGISSGLNRSFEETLGMVTVLGDFGLKGSQAGTGIQALLTRLLTGDTTVITQAQAEVAPGNALEKFYEFEKLAKPDGNLLPMSDVIDEMNTTMEDMTDEEQAWFAKKLFGLYQMKSAYALMNGDDVDLNDLIKEIETMSEGTNENKLQQLLDSQYGQLTSLNNLWEGIKTDVGDRLSPFVDAVRDELFQFLSSDGNYNINFDNLRSALDESCDLIEEKYGSAIANAVQGLGDFTIDLTQVMSEIAPEMGSGMLEFFGSLFSGDVFGEGGAIEDWGTMIDDMYTAVDGLPEDLQGLGDAVVGCIDWFGKLMALNVASEIAELISSVLQILTIAGGAMIHVMGGVVVNGSTVTSAGGSSFTQWGAGAGAGANANAGSSVIGSADDVAKALGTTSDDIIATFGKQATYSIDDVAKGLGTSVDDVISGLGLTTKSVSALSKLGKGLSVAGIGIEAVTTGIDAYNAFSSGDDKGGTEEIFGGIGSIGGGFGGAKIGSIIGTAIAPGIGTAIGGVIGAIGGALLGDYVGEQSGGFIYDITNPGETTNEYQKLTNKGEKYKKQLEDLQSKLDELTSAGGGSSIEAYKLKNKIDELTTAFNNMGDVTLVGLIEKSEQLKKVIDGIAEVQEQKEVQADETADQAKSYIATLDSLPDTKDENDMTIAQDIIDRLNQEYDMGITMDETGKYNMTTGKMWDKVDTSVEQTKTDANMEALLGYLTQYQQAQSRYDDANKTMNNEYDDYEYARDNIFKEEHPFLAWTGWADGAEMNWGGTTKQEYEEYKVAKDAVSSTAEEFNKLSEAIRGSYEAMGYTKEEIDNKMADLALSSAKATEENRNLTGNDLNIDNATINITNTSMPDILKRVKENNPGWAVYNEKGMQQAIENQIQLDNQITMTPAFSVSAPNVNVNVKVDRDGNITRNTSILNPAQGSLLNNWYSRTSSQYGRTTK